MILDHSGRSADRVDDRHWQSGFPHPFGQVGEAGFDLVVLTCAEAQPTEEDVAHVKRTWPHLSLILAPYDDTEDLLMLPFIVKIARGVSARVAERLGEGKNVLVTCAAGLNRSGLVSAMVLMRRRGISGREAAERVRAARRGALVNKSFSAYLDSLPAGGLK